MSESKVSFTSCLMRCLHLIDFEGSIDVSFTAFAFGGQFVCKCIFLTNICTFDDISSEKSVL